MPTCRTWVSWGWLTRHGRPATPGTRYPCRLAHRHEGDHEVLDDEGDVLFVEQHTPASEAARLLEVPIAPLRAWVAQYRREHADERRGRPHLAVSDADVARALETTGGNQRAAATLLGVSEGLVRLRLKGR